MKAKPSNNWRLSTLGRVTVGTVAAALCLSSFVSSARAAVAVPTRTLSIGGQQIDDGYIIKANSDTNITTKFWIDTNAAVTHVNAVHTPSGTAHVLYPQSCASNPECPSANGWLVVDTQSLVQAGVFDNVMLYSFATATGTFKHRTRVFNSSSKAATDTLWSPVGVVPRTAFLQMLESRLMEAANGVLQQVNAEANAVSIYCNDMTVSVSGSETDVAAGGPGEELHDGSVLAKFGCGSLSIYTHIPNASVLDFQLVIQDVWLYARVALQIPEPDGTVSEGGQPARWAGAQLGGFTTSWFQPATYGNVQNQSPQDWVAGEGEIGVAVTDLQLRVGNYENTSGQNEPTQFKNAIEADCTPTWNPLCETAAEIAEDFAEEQLAQYSYYLSQDAVLSGLRAGNLVEIGWLIDAILALVGDSGEADMDDQFVYCKIMHGLAAVWEMDSSTNSSGHCSVVESGRGLSVDRFTNLRGMVEYVVNEILHFGAPPVMNEPRSIAVSTDALGGSEWLAYLGHTDIVSTSAQETMPRFIMYATLDTPAVTPGTPVGAPGAEVRYYGRYVQGSALSNPKVGSADALMGLSAAENVANQLLWNFATEGLLNQAVTANNTAIQLRALSAPIAQFETTGEYSVLLPSVEFAYERPGARFGFKGRLTTDARMNVEVVDILESDLADVVEYLSFDVNTQMLVGGAFRLLPLELENTLQLDGDSPAGYLDFESLLNQTILGIVKWGICGAGTGQLTPGFAPIGYDPATYCSGADRADTYFAYFVHDPEPGESAPAPLLFGLPGGFGAKQIEVDVVQGEKPTFVCDGGNFREHNADSTTNVYPLTTSIVYTTMDIDTPSSVQWSSSNPALVSVDSSGVATVNTNLEGTAVVTAAIVDPVYGTDLSVGIVFFVTDEPFDQDPCYANPHIPGCGENGGQP